MKKLLLLAIAAPLGAQAPAVRLAPAAEASSRPLFGVVPAVRALPGGKLLVNDVTKRQLTLLDATLANPTIVADSAAGTASSYGVRAGGLIAYTADSTFFVDPAGLSMFVLDPSGKIARVASVPRSQDAPFLGNNMLGMPGLDAKGRLVYRGGITFIRNQGAGGRGAAPANGLPFAIPEPPDSVALLRLDLGTRKVDTAAYFKIPKTKLNITQTEKGISATSTMNPLPVVDDWAVLADGSIAIVRGQDYHVDIIAADGTVKSGGKIPYDWQRLSDDDKVAVIDSAKKAAEANLQAMKAGLAGVAGATPDGGPPRMVMNINTGGGDGGGGLAQRMMAGGGAAMGVPDFVSPSELPDYRPVFTAGAAKADADGNVWVRTTAVRPGAAGPIYDVIDNRGELVDRVQIPAGRQIVGFAKGGVIYMAARDASGTWIERTHR